jgi:hypothetical protein
MKQASKKASLRFRFEAKIIEWRGPAPFFYAPMPLQQADELRQIANRVSYGWGCIPVEAKMCGVTYTTSLFPRDGTYLLPVKVVVRRQANVTVGDKVAVDMIVQPARR